MAEFLLEVGLEEVPARMLAAAEAELGERARAMLERERLLGDGATIVTYSTPRRLAVFVSNVLEKQPDAEEQLTGPAWAIAFKSSAASEKAAPTPAALAFAKKAGVAVEALQPLTTAKGVYTSAVAARPGRTALDLLPELLPKELAGLSWPKPMYWRAGKPERFVRPVQWLVALLDSALVPVEFAGVRAGRESRGHRVLHGVEPVVVDSPGGYAEALRAAFVEPLVFARRHTIRKALDQVTRAVPGARWREDEALVETVTHLTEWPSVLAGAFAAEYLALPEEVLVTVMRDHQKYFAVEDAQSKLMPHFLTVLNTQPDAAGEAAIRHGNERVLRARFSDAKFFWDFDQRVSLEERVELLKAVTFQKDLGSYYEKTERTRAIAATLGALVQERGTKVDLAALDRAALLAKADLTTELVKEFTELQGIVGGLYARAAGESEAVVKAIYRQYRPASIDDDVPTTVEGRILGLADRMGTISDMFALGLEPTGSKDPYALRRAAGAVIRILAVSKLPIQLRDLESTKTKDYSRTLTQEPLIGPFLTERLTFYLRETLRFDRQVVKAVMGAALHKAVVTELFVPGAIGRARAVADVYGTDTFKAIAEAFKRSKNIIVQAEKEFGIVVKSSDIVSRLIEEPAEIDLDKQIVKISSSVEVNRQMGKFSVALTEMASLRPFVERFFNDVMVMAQDQALRKNRLALLKFMLEEFSAIADFSELSPAAAE